MHAACLRTRCDLAVIVLHPERTFSSMCSCLRMPPPLYRPQAPEVLRRDYGPAADVWSLGVCLYTLLSGLLPFFGETEEEVFDMVLHAGGLLFGFWAQD